MANNENKSRYPYDIFNAITKTRAFSIAAHLVKEDEKSPLMIFHDAFTRFEFVAVDLTKNENKAATCNVHVSDIPAIVKKTEYAFNKFMESANVALSSEESSNIAYTRRFKTGNLSGKSPAEVLIENGEKGKEILNNQYNFLKENLEKFPKNKELMDAIVEASKLDLSKISENAPVAAAPINIFTLSTRPLIRKRREDGKCPCYEAKIEYVPGNKYPILVTVENYYAPVKENENGTLNVQLSAKDTSSIVSNQIFLSFEDWLYAVDQMSNTVNCFRTINFKSALDLADKFSKEERDLAGVSNKNKPATNAETSSKESEVINMEVKTFGPVEDSSNGYKKIHILISEGNEGTLLFDEEGRNSLGNNWNYIVENAPSKQIKLSVKAEKKGDYYKFIERI